jgi:hypothetical protein
MTVNLTPTELADLESGRAIPIKASGSSMDYVLVRADLYQRVVAPDAEDIDAMYPLLAEISPEDWQDAAEYGLNRGQS